MHTQQTEPEPHETNSAAELEKGCSVFIFFAASQQGGVLDCHPAEHCEAARVVSKTQLNLAILTEVFFSPFVIFPHFLYYNCVFLILQKCTQNLTSRIEQKPASLREEPLFLFVSVTSCEQTQQKYSM